MPEGYAKRVLVAVLIVVAVVGAAVILWAAADLFLLIFAAILLAILLRACGDWVSRRTRAGPGWSLALVIVALATLLFLVGWFSAPGIAAQVDQLAETLPQALARLRSWLAGYPGVDRLLSQFDRLGPVFSRIFSSTLGALGNIVVVLFVALYLAVNPGAYVSGLVRLFPPANRPRAAGILAEIGHTLRRWLLGRFAGMAFVAAGTYIGLKLLGSPMAFSLALLAGLLDFVPNIGPLVAAVPAVLIALVDSPVQALWIALLYTGVQTLEGYILMPYVQQRNLALPPALLIAGQVFFALLLGGLGLLVATPLVAVILVLVRELYLRGTLGEKV